MNAMQKQLYERQLALPLDANDVILDEYSELFGIFDF